MPATTYMGVDARSDHSLRVPRPDRTILIGTPNACNTCHKDKSATWARDAIKAWHPTQRPGAQQFAEAFDLADRRAPGAQKALAKVATDAETSSIARASALARMRNFASPLALEIATNALAIEDPLVRVAAVSIIAESDAATRRSLLVPLLRDKWRLVRMDAARALVGEPSSGLLGDDRAAFSTALAEYVEGQRFNAERPETHLNLGTLFLQQNQPDAAQKSFRTAIDLDGTFAAASIALAHLERTQGDEAAAEKTLLAALSKNPASAPTLHELGLSKVRQGRVDEAMDYLGRAADLQPANARFAYVYAVALHDIGKQLDATKVLKVALVRNPYDRDLLSALISYEMEASNFSTALEVVELLNSLEPDDAALADLLARLRRRVR